MHHTKKKHENQSLKIKYVPAAPAGDSKTTAAPLYPPPVVPSSIIPTHSPPRTRENVTFHSVQLQQAAVTYDRVSLPLVLPGEPSSSGCYEGKKYTLTRCAIM